MIYIYPHCDIPDNWFLKSSALRTGQHVNEIRRGAGTLKHVPWLPWLPFPVPPNGIAELLAIARLVKKNHPKSQ